MCDNNRRDVDGGWAWVALVASVANLCLYACFVVSVGLFQVEFFETFSGSKGFIALIGALALSGQTMLGPVAGILSNLLSPRVTIMIGSILLSLGCVAGSFSEDLIALLVAFGLLTGIGAGLSYTPSVTIVSTYFHEYRVVANGISLAAPGIGVLIGPYLLRWLIGAHGWRYAMSIFGCILAQTCVLACLFFPHDPSVTPSCCHKRRPPPPPPETKLLQPPEDRSLSRLKNAHSPGVKEMVGSRTAMHVSEFGSMLLSNSVVWTVEEVTSSTLRQRVKQLLSRRFMWVMCLNQFLLYAGFSINTVLFPSYAQSVGVPINDLPPIYLVYGITMTVCRIAGGFIFSRVPNHLLKLFFCFQVAVAFVLFLLPIYGTSGDSLFVYKFLVGLTYGPTFLLVTPILIHHVGLDDLSVAFGVIMLCCGLGYVIAPPIGGMMYDVFGSYRVTYYIAGSTIGVAALSLLLLLLVKDLNPPEDADVKKEILLSANQKDSDNASSDTQNETVKEKPCMNGGGNSQVHVIYDVEDLREYITCHNRHS
ncbi:monocarboxylate transporter 14-like [Littorina saxatilis]|uniref:Major facilitator superfamily (MFS) profile domain-containing protein n=1 Tax=Littorina saxatilis TaxID=31220 RepID=A0AAN9AXF4_9CAEN